MARGGKTSSVSPVGLPAELGTSRAKPRVGIFSVRRRLIR